MKMYSPWGHPRCRSIKNVAWHRLLAIVKAFKLIQRRWSTLSFSFHNTLIDGLKSCGFLSCFYQLLGLSFWRHPFTVKDPLVSKWCNTKFLQIYSNEETNIYILNGLRVCTFSGNCIWVTRFFNLWCFLGTGFCLVTWECKDSRLLVPSLWHKLKLAPDGSIIAHSCHWPGESPARLECSSRQEKTVSWITATLH